MGEEHKKFRAKLYRNDNVACHGKLYRKKFILDNNIRYMKLRGNEDTAYNMLLECLGAKYYDLDVLTYRWCFNYDSFTRKDDNYHEQDLYTFAKGFVWTAEQIELRKEQIDRPVWKLCGLLAKIYYRTPSCWYPETKKQMLIFAAKIYLICKKVENVDIKQNVIDYFKECGVEDPELVDYCISETRSNLLDLDEYKELQDYQRYLFQ